MPCRANLVCAGTLSGTACEIAKNLNPIENGGNGLANFRVAGAFRRQNMDVASGIDGDEDPICAAEQDFDGVPVLLWNMEKNGMVVNDFHECAHNSLSFLSRRILPFKGLTERW